MPELEALFAENDNWLEALPAYQRQTIEALLNAGKTPDEVAQLWLTTSGPANTSPHGAGRFPSLFYDKLIEEVERFVCDDPTYAAERQNLLHEVGAGKAFLVGAIATALAPHLGVAAAVIGPSIALILQIVSRVGARAWCETRAAMRAANPAPAPADQ
jgi:hypothetical protein